MPGPAATVASSAVGMTGYALAALYGPTPVPDAIAHLETLLDGVEDDRRTSGLLRCLLAQLLAMNGEIEAARLTYRAARAALEDLGRNVLAASVSLNSWRVEMLARDPAAAERELRRDHAALEAMGERYLLSTVAGALAMTLIVQGRLDEAEAVRRAVRGAGHRRRRRVPGPLARRSGSDRGPPG